MASLTRHHGGWLIQYLSGGKRKSFYPGPMDKRNAENFRRNLEALLSARTQGTYAGDDAAKWLARQEPATRVKLYEHGLIEKPAEVPADPAETLPSLPLQEFLRKHLAGRAGKGSSKIVFARCQALLVAYFGKDRILRSITMDNVKDFRAWMLEKGNQRTKGAGLGENTTRKMCSIACSFFEDAKERGLTDANHFAKRSIPKTVRENRNRDFFVTREMSQQVLDACPDPEWKLIVALTRYGGLRCPSETLSLRWVDVLWDRDRIIVTAPKTEHYEGKGQRVIPIFPELRPYLDVAFHAAPDGAEFCIGRYRDLGANLGTQFKRIVKRAGLLPWAKPFHNMRASRETELADQFPIKTVCSWIGNSPTVAVRNYLTVPDEHFTRAASMAKEPCNALSNAEPAAT